ncbi:MAG: ABC transporter ATP-binding protein [Candidatus Eremiobacteraeota bacterium]|nr:ABC transporter ATP-binding protein [Candidatus Eremiobacteraeota bacterium]
MSDALVTASNLCKTFHSPAQDIVAVRDANCSVAAGARIALFGPSGSGKSTLLQILGGLDAPTTGTVSWPAFGGPTDLRPAHISFVFQNQTLLPSLTVRENVEMPLLLGEKERDTRSRALEALARLNLDELAEKLPEELSGGQAQRVAFARALVGRPQLIFADEPTGQLDHQTADSLFDAVLPWLDDMGAAIVIATHDHAVGKRFRERWTMRFGALETHA